MADPSGAMQVIAEQTWSWLLLSDGQHWWLSVVCGSVGLFERNIELDAVESLLWTQGGEAALRRFARRIQADPAAWSTRHLPDFDAIPGITAAIAQWRARTAPAGTAH